MDARLSIEILRKILEKRLSMSFSSEVKEELVKKTDSARHCQIAEFAAFMGMSGNVSETDNGELCLEFVTENELSVEKFSDLLLKYLALRWMLIRIKWLRMARKLL